MQTSYSWQPLLNPVDLNTLRDSDVLGLDISIVFSAHQMILVGGWSRELLLLSFINTTSVVTGSVL